MIDYYSNKLNCLSAYTTQQNKQSKNSSSHSNKTAKEYCMTTTIIVLSKSN